MKRLLLSSAAAVVALMVASPAFAGTITLDFGSLANTATNAQIQSYIDNLLPSGDAVLVTGAAGSCNTGGKGVPIRRIVISSAPSAATPSRHTPLPIKMAGVSSAPGATLLSAGQTRSR